MSELFGVGHVAQLSEIQNARLRRGMPGIGSHVEDLIARLTSGGVAGRSDDPRIVQAKRLWDLCADGELGAATFDEYLVTIPSIPLCLLGGEGRLAEFPYLVLEEPRVPIKRLCEFCGIDHRDDEFRPAHEPFADPKKPHWLRLNNGRKNLGRKTDQTLLWATVASCEIPLTALQGVCAYLQHSTILVDGSPNGSPMIMDLAGSISHEFDDAIAVLARKETLRLTAARCPTGFPNRGLATRLIPTI